MDSLDDIDLDGLISFIKEDIKKDSNKKYCIAGPDGVCYYDHMVMCDSIRGYDLDINSAFTIMDVLSDIGVLKTRLHNGDKLYAI